MTGDRVRVGDVLSLERRAVVVSLGEMYEEIGIRSFGKGVFHKEPVPGGDLGSKRVFSIEAGDLLLSNVFAWEGAIAVAGKQDQGKIGSHRFMTYTPVDSRIDTTWAAWYFRSEPGLELVRQASPGSAGRNRTLAIGRFAALEIPLPPITEQRRIAAELDRIADTASRLTELTARAAVLTRAASVSLTTRPDLTESEKARAGWQRIALGEALNPSGVTTSVEPADSYSIAGIWSFGRGLIDRGSIVGAETSYSSLTMIRQDDVVVSKLNGWEGAIAVVPEKFDGHFVSSEYPVFSIDPKVLVPEYFTGLASSPDLWDELDANARGSMVRRRRISSGQFLAARVWVPPISVQKSVAGSLGSTDRVDLLRSSAQERIDALTAAALNAAFTD